jgi:hypothetical protein
MVVVVAKRADSIRLSNGEVSHETGGCISPRFAENWPCPTRDPRFFGANRVDFEAHGGETASASASWDRAQPPMGSLAAVVKPRQKL